MLYTFKQLNIDNRKIQDIFYKNYLKLFVSQINYLTFNKIKNNSFVIY